MAEDGLISHLLQRQTLIVFISLVLETAARIGSNACGGTTGARQELWAGEARFAHQRRQQLRFFLETD